MAKNINQLPTAATSVLASDKMYLGRSPFGITDDRYILGSDLIAQFAGPLTTKGDLFTFTTVSARLPVGVTNGQILQVDSGTATGLAWSTPSYPSASGLSGQLIRSDGTNNSYTTSSYPSTNTINTLLYASAANVMSELATANNGVLVTGATGTPSILAGPGASGRVLSSNAGAAPSWSTSTFPVVAGAVGTILRSDGTNYVASTATFADTYTASNLLYSNGANTVVGLATAVNGVLVTSAAGVPSILVGPGVSGKFLSSVAAGAPVWSTATFPTTAGAVGTILRSDGTNYVASTSTFADTYAASTILYSNGVNTVTGLATANNGTLVTSATGVPSILAGPGTTGNILKSNAAAAHSFSTATYPSTTSINQILYSSANNIVSGLATVVAGVLTTVLSVPTWATQLSLALGGTNASLVADNGGIVYSDATKLAILASTATARKMLQSGSSAAPAWSTTTWPATSTANQLLYSSATNTISEITTANSSILTTNGSGVPSWSTVAQTLALLNGPITKIGSQLITATGAFTYTPTAGTVYAIFELQAGGGGSGGTTGAGGQSAHSGAGGGGAYMKILVTGATNLANITGSVGIAGTAGSSGVNSGGTGGNTTLTINGGTVWTSSGGTGGAGKASSASAQQSGAAGAGGGATAGTNATLMDYTGGGNAGYGASFGNVSYWSQSVAGGSRLGASSAGNSVANGWGVGGGGYQNFTGSNQAGLAGIQGVVVVTEFISS